MRRADRAGCSLVSCSRSSIRSAVSSCSVGLDSTFAASRIRTRLLNGRDEWRKGATRHRSMLSRISNGQQSHPSTCALIFIATGAAVVTTSSLVYAQEDDSNISGHQSAKTDMLEQWLVEERQLLDEQRETLQQIDSILLDLLKVACDWPLLSSTLVELDQRAREVEELERRVPGSTETMYGLQPWYRRSVFSFLVANAVGVSLTSSVTALLSGQADPATAALLGLASLGVQLLTSLAMGHHWLSPASPQQQPPRPRSKEDKEGKEEDEDFMDMLQKARRKTEVEQPKTTEELKQEFKDMMVKEGTSPVGKLIGGLVMVNDGTLSLDADRLSEEENETLKKVNDLWRAYTKNIKRLAELYKKLRKPEEGVESDTEVQELVSALTEEEKKAFYARSEEVIDRLFGFEVYFSDRWGDKLGSFFELILAGAFVFTTTGMASWDLQQRISQANKTAAVPFHPKGIAWGLFTGALVGLLPVSSDMSYGPWPFVLPVLASSLLSYSAIRLNRFWSSLLLFREKSTEEALADVAKQKELAEKVIERTKEIASDGASSLSKNVTVSRA